MASKRGVSDDLDKRTKRSIVLQHMCKGKQLLIYFHLLSIATIRNACVINQTLELYRTCMLIVS